MALDSCPELPTQQSAAFRVALRTDSIQDPSVSETIQSVGPLTCRPDAVAMVKQQSTRA